MNREAADALAGKTGTLRFADFFGQNENIVFLKRLLTEGGAHSLIFSGAPGSGRHSLAKATAKWLLCEKPAEEGACGECSSCRYFEGGVHPDFKAVDRGEENLIRVERVRREIVSDLQMYPQLSSRKIYLVDGDDLNEQGQNALLKSLEEPPPYALFMLTVERRDVLLPTLLSRSAEVKLRPLSKEDIQEILQRKGVRDPGGFYSSYAQGNPGKALDLAARDDLAELREHATQILEATAFHNALQLQETELPLLRKEKERLPEILDLMQLAIRDLALLAAGQEGDVINRDQIGRLRELSDSLQERLQPDAESLKGRLLRADRFLREIRRAEVANVNHEILSWQLLQELQEALQP